MRNRKEDFQCSWGEMPSFIRLLNYLLLLALSTLETHSFTCSAQQQQRQKQKQKQRYSLCPISSSRNFYIPDALVARAEKGMVRMNELDRLFALNSFEVDNIKRPLSKSFIGFIFSLEGGIVDTAALFVFSFTLLADECNKPAPNPIEVKDLIGSEFRDIIIGLGWNVHPYDIPSYEEKFYMIMKKVLANLPNINRIAGSETFIKEIVADNNEITVKTALPRDIAIMLLGKSKLSNLFDGKVNPDNLVYYTSSNQTTSTLNYGGQTVESSKLVECCFKMKKPSTLSLLVDGSRKNIITAKRLGLSCIAVKGSCIEFVLGRVFTHTIYLTVVLLPIYY